MKHVRRIFAFAVALFMALAVVTPAFAAEIEVKNVVNDETYTAYKILNYRDNGETGKNRVVTYYLTDDQYKSGLGTTLTNAGFVFKQASNNSDWFVDNAATVDVAAVAANLRNWDGADALKSESVVAADNKADFKNLDTGYYFVTTTTGSLCALHENTGIETVVEKNTLTTPDKKQSKTEGNYSDAQLDLNIGDTVYYDVDVTIGKGADKDIVLTDTLSAGLTLNESSIEVKKDNATVDSNSYTINSKSASGYKLTLKADYVKTLKENDVVTVTYSAIINEKAVIRGENSNEIDLEYSEQHMTDEKTIVKTYDANLKKTDGTKALSGAEFNIYKQENGGEALTFKKDTTGYYIAKGDGAAATIAADDGKGVNIRGLEPGDYYLEETKTPDGFNPLSSRQKFTVTKDAMAEVPITVVNQKGATMPSTGGIGTTIFYIVGGVMVAGAVVFLLTKRRAAAE